MGALDPRLQSLLVTRDHHEKRVETGEVARADTPVIPDRVGVLVKLTGSIDDLISAGLETGSVIGQEGAPFRIVTGTIALDRVEELAAIPHVVKVEMGRNLQRELDVSTVEIRAKPLHTAPSPLTGRGIVVGVIDGGLDYRHHAFRFASGGSRVLFIWDQTLTVRPRRPGDPFQEAPPPEFPNGVEYTQAQIDQALHATHPLDVVRTQDDPDAHGTHVTGIAAGDGSQAGTRSGDHCTGANTYIGVAPDADIIFVRNKSDNQALGESQNLVDAVNYIFTRAGQLDAGAGRPCVINISEGDNLGPHDGTSLVEQSIDMMLNIPRRVVVKSAGNEGAAKHHALATVPLAGSHTFAFQVKANDTSDRPMECWYDGTQSLDVTLSAPGVAAPSPVVHPGDPPLVWPVNAAGVTATITSSTFDPDNGDSHVLIEIKSPVGVALPNGTWNLVFTNTGPAATDVHCWLERGRHSPVFTSDVTRSHTISLPGTSPNVITVGSYSAREFSDGAVGDLADSSSRGPTRNGTQKPDISAPGVKVTSAKADSHGGCCCDCCYDFYLDMSGTSMAAPHVTGVVALMFQKNKTADVAAIRTALITTARSPNPIVGPTLPNNDYGAGNVDATAAVNALPPAPGAAGGGGGGGGPAPPPYWMPPSLDMDDRALFRRLQRFQSWVLAFPQGHYYAALVSRHVDEVLRLINTNRRVATVWHRNGGPVLIRAALEIANEPALAAIPAKLNGEPLAPRLDRILDNWRRYASPALATDIDRYRADIVTLPGRALAEILGAQESAA